MNHYKYWVEITAQCQECEMFFKSLKGPFSDVKEIELKEVTDHICRFAKFMKGEKIKLADGTNTGIIIDRMIPVSEYYIQHLRRYQVIDADEQLERLKKTIENMQPGAWDGWGYAVKLDNPTRPANLQDVGNDYLQYEKQDFFQHIFFAEPCLESIEEVF